MQIEASQRRDYKPHFLKSSQENVDISSQFVYSFAIFKVSWSWRDVWIS